MSSWMDNEVPFESLVGKTLVSVENVTDDLLRFVADDGDVFEMYHYQDCCESVSIEDICGELEWLVGSPILHAEESSNESDPKPDEYDESHTWTFYHLRTMKGTVTVRWYGTSNGYYSESVDFRLVTKSDAQ